MPRQLTVVGGHERPGRGAGLDRPHRQIGRASGGGEAAARLHDPERRVDPELRQPAGEHAEVGPEQGRQVGVDGGRVRPLVLPPLQRDVGGDRHRHVRQLLAQELGRPALVARRGVGVQVRDRHGLDAGRPQLGGDPAHLRVVERLQDRAVRQAALGELPRAGAGHDRRRLLDLDVVHAVAERPLDLQDVAEAARREERRDRASPLEDGVRAERRRVDQLLDLAGGHARAGERPLEPVADRPDQVVRLREHLLRVERPVRPLEHQVDEGAADVDPDANPPPAHPPTALTPTRRAGRASRRRSAGRCRCGCAAPRASVLRRPPRRPRRSPRARHRPRRARAPCRRRA